MSPDAGLLDLAYVGAFLGDILLLALLWHVHSPTAGGRQRRSTDRRTLPASAARGRARTVRPGDARPAHAACDPVIPRP